MGRTDGCFVDLDSHCPMCGQLYDDCGCDEALGFTPRLFSLEDEKNTFNDN